MKKILIGVIIAVLLVGVYISWKTYFSKKADQENVVIHEGNRTIVMPKAQYEAEVTKSKIARANGELRMLQTGLEAYKLDYKEYPPNLFVVSTPIAYILKVPKDVFDENVYYQYRKTADGFLVWSIGPDGKDDNSEINFDPNAGLTSQGDIVRHQE